MTFSFSFLTLLLFLGFGQALTISIILIFRFFRKQHNDILFNLLFFLTLYIYLTDLLVPTGIFRGLHFLLFTDFPVLFLIPPVLLFYVQKTIDEKGNFRITGFRILHFAPFLVILIFHIPRFLINPGVKVDMFETGMIPPPFIGGVSMFLLGILQFFLYLLYCFYLVFIRVKRDQRSRIGSLKTILFFYLIIFLSFTYFLLISRNYPQRDFSSFRLALDFPIIIISVYYYYILISGKELPHPSGEPEKKYRKSGLQPRENCQICDDLSRIIVKEKLWSDPDLDLRGLAEKTGYTYHNLSQAINQTTGLNYHAFMNRYRIEEACRLLLETEMIILDIAFASGFNSKATFNTVFKKEKNCTPTQFRANHRKK